MSVMNVINGIFKAKNRDVIARIKEIKRRLPPKSIRHLK